MKSISLPEPDETKISIRIGNREPIEIDLFDHNDMVDEIKDEMKAVGTSDNRAMMELYVKKVKDRWGIDLALTTAIEMMSYCLDFSEELKKKFFDRLGSQDSSTSELTDSSTENSENKTSN